MDCDSLIKNNKYNAKELIRRGSPSQQLPIKIVCFKPGRKRLVVQTTSVLHTNGVTEIKEEESKSPRRVEMWVPWLGVDKSKLEISDNIMIDIDAESTRLPIFCPTLHINEGGISSKKLLAQGASGKRVMRDVGLQIGATDLNTSFGKHSSLRSSENESYSCVYYYKNWRINRDQASKQSKSVQVDEFIPDKVIYTSSPIIPTRSSLVMPVHEDLVRLPVSASVGTDDDFLVYLRLNNYHLDLSLSKRPRSASTPSAEQVLYSSQARIKYRKRPRSSSASSGAALASRQIQYKHFECPLTGQQRSVILTPFETAYNSLLDANSALDKHDHLEEYIVVDNFTDTSDFNKYMDLENYSFGQLMSNKTRLDKIEIMMPEIPKYVPNSDAQSRVEKIHQCFIETNKELEQLKQHQPYKPLVVSFSPNMMPSPSCLSSSRTPHHHSHTFLDESPRHPEVVSLNSSMQNEENTAGCKRQRVESSTSKCFKDLIDMIDRKFEEINDLKDRYCMNDKDKCLINGHIYDKMLHGRTLDQFNISLLTNKTRAYSTFKLNSTSEDQDENYFANRTINENLMDSRSRRSQNELLKQQIPGDVAAMQQMKTKSKSSDQKCEQIYSRFDKLIKNACDLSSMNAKLMQELTNNTSLSSTKS